MSKENLRKFIYSSRIVLCFLTIIITVAWILLLKSAINSSYEDDCYVLKYRMLYILAIAWIFLFSFAIASFFLKLKEFRTKGHRYVLYLGWHKDVLICDGTIVDMFKGMSFSAVNLEYDDGNDEEVIVRISPFFNASTVKVNGRVLY